MYIVSQKYWSTVRDGISKKYGASSESNLFPLRNGPRISAELVLKAELRIRNSSGDYNTKYNVDEA